jgi:hypothetical protein
MAPFWAWNSILVKIKNLPQNLELSWLHPNRPEKSPDWMSHNELHWTEGRVLIEAVRGTWIKWYPRK